MFSSSEKCGTAVTSVQQLSRQPDVLFRESPNVRHSSVAPRDRALVMCAVFVIKTTYTFPTLGAPVTDLDGDILTIVVLTDDDRSPGVDAAALLALMSLLQMDASIRQHLVRNRTFFGVLLILRHDFPLWL